MYWYWYNIAPFRGFVPRSSLLRGHPCRYIMSVDGTSLVVPRSCQLWRPPLRWWITRCQGTIPQQLPLWTCSFWWKMYIQDKVEEYVGDDEFFASLIPVLNLSPVWREWCLEFRMCLLSLLFDKLVFHTWLFTTPIRHTYWLCHDNHFLLCCRYCQFVRRIEVAMDRLSGTSTPQLLILSRYAFPAILLLVLLLLPKDRIEVAVIRQFIAPSLVAETHSSLCFFAFLNASLESTLSTWTKKSSSMKPAQK